MKQVFLSTNPRVKTREERTVSRLAKREHSSRKATRKPGAVVVTVMVSR